jgi:hypothetical protein
MSSVIFQNRHLLAAIQVQTLQNLPFCSEMIILVEIQIWNIPQAEFKYWQVNLIGCANSSQQTPNLR